MNDHDSKKKISHLTVKIDVEDYQAIKCGNNVTYKTGVWVYMSNIFMYLLTSCYYSTWQKLLRWIMTPYMQRGTFFLRLIEMDKCCIYLYNPETKETYESINVLLVCISKCVIRKILVKVQSFCFSRILKRIFPRLLYEYPEHLQWLLLCVCREITLLTQSVDGTSLWHRISYSLIIIS